MKLKILICFYQFLKILNLHLETYYFIKSSEIRQIENFKNIRKNIIYLIIGLTIHLFIYNQYINQIFKTENKYFVTENLMKKHFHLPLSMIISIKDAKNIIKTLMYEIDNIVKNNVQYSYTPARIFTMDESIS